MTPARRTELSRMVVDGELEQVPVDPTVCRTMVEQARRHARTAAAGRDMDDLEGAFQLAYDGCRKVALALVLSFGVRPSGERGHHADTFAAAAAIVRNHAGQGTLGQAVDDASDLRFARSGAEYRAEVVDESAVDDALTILDELLVGLVPVMEGRLATG
ncbi:hypothetical protein [Cellulomonas sp. ES6]|uniref:hypothetical protein n=1 Tax=Cellulomonas sp. ES6 TaxID=3039384 RepID=UPI0024B79251|nr:hypothetical protein [Cellulomonas sp. ES6]WHP16848.1 hypothetical protein P9841_14710 [Cellulomonas sp. ES6]